MKRYLLVNTGYQFVAIPYENSERLAQLVSALGDAQMVESKGYGDEQRYIPTSSDPLPLQFINGDKITIGDEVATLKAQLAEANQSKEQYSEWWTTESAKTRALESEIVKLKTPPPEASPL